MSKLIVRKCLYSTLTIRSLRSILLNKLSPKALLVFKDWIETFTYSEECIKEPFIQGRLSKSGWTNRANTRNALRREQQCLLQRSTYLFAWSRISTCTCVEGFASKWWLIVRSTPLRKISISRDQLWTMRERIVQLVTSMTDSSTSLQGRWIIMGVFTWRS